MLDFTIGVIILKLATNIYLTPVLDNKEYCKNPPPSPPIPEEQQAHGDRGTGRRSILD